MNTRFDEYTTENDLETQNLSRYKRNASLYKRMKEEELDSFDVESNTQVLENSSNVIDIEKLRDMLDKKYREPKKKVNLDIDTETTERRRVNLDETREYNVNDFISKAYAEDETDYEIERLKKLRNTNIDILNDLDIKTEEKSDYVYADDKSDESRKLRELIDTITLKEQINAESDPLDILTDLKGDDDTTKVLGAKESIAEENTKEAPDIKGLDKLVSNDKEDEEDTDDSDDEDDDTKEEELTSSDIFEESDFDDFKDLQDGAKTKIFVKLLIFIVILAILVGLVFLLNKELGWGLF